ncbi:MAG: hypothetical protein OEV79_08005 [candidate division WOR-3 bacterium]|nr:hypothetical protein [candidate division WOR-3 bacterium]
MYNTMYRGVSAFLQKSDDIYMLIKPSKKLADAICHSLVFLLIMMSVFCSGPGESGEFIEIHYHINWLQYDLSSSDSLELSVFTTNSSGTKYAWFTLSGDGGVYVGTPSTIPEGDTVWSVLTWKPSPANIPAFNQKYKITAYMDTRAQPAANPEFVSTRTVPCSLYLEGYTMQKWSGDSQRVRLYESLDDTSGYKLRIRLTDDNQGVNQFWVTFLTNKGYFKESGSDYYSTYTYWLQDTAGLAEATLVCDESSFPEDSFDYQVVVSSDSSNSVSFAARCSYDEEISGLMYPYTHKKRTYPAGPEIRGDILADYAMEDLHPTEKNVKIEVDFDPNVLTLSELTQIACSTWNILERGRLYPDSANTTSGVWIEIASISSSDTVYCPSNMTTWYDVRSALARSRDSINHIHCVFGTNFGDSVMGKAIIDTLFLPDESSYEQRVFRYGHKSSGVNMRHALDSTGVFLFVTHIKAKASECNKDWRLLASWVFAHEIGHALQMGHTDPFEFQTNIMMLPAHFADWNWETYSFFNIRSLEDAMTPPAYFTPFWRPALTTREKLGVNTVGHNYYSREGGEMMMLSIPLLSLLLSGHNDSALSRGLPEVISQIECIDMGIGYRGHYEPFIARIEDDSNLGIMYLTREGGNIAYNYVRYDTLGNMILDLRKFKTIKRFVTDDLETIDLVIPNGDYCIDENGNLWLFYVEGPSVYKKYVGWLKIDKNGTVLEERHSDFVAHLDVRSIPSTQRNFHLLLTPFSWLANSHFRYYNPNLGKPERIGMLVTGDHVPVQPFSAFNVVPLADDRLLVVSCDVYEPFLFRHFIIDSDGHIERKSEDIPIESCAYSKVENHGMVFNIDAFPHHDSIFAAVFISTPWLKNAVEVFYLVKFDSEGNLIRPEKGITKAEIYATDEMPADVRPVIVLSSVRGKRRSWIYGCDSQGNLFMRKWTDFE